MRRPSSSAAQIKHHVHEERAFELSQVRELTSQPLHERGPGDYARAIKIRHEPLASLGYGMKKGLPIGNP